MTESGRPYGGTNDPSREEGLPGERPEEGDVSAAPEQSPRAAQGGMSDDVTHVPEGGNDPDGKKPDMPDATGPQG
jgi:hypothetical protein